MSSLIFFNRAGPSLKYFIMFSFPPVIPAHSAYQVYLAILYILFLSSELVDSISIYDHISQFIYKQSR